VMFANPEGVEVAAARGLAVVEVALVETEEFVDMVVELLSDGRAVPVLLEVVFVLVVALVFTMVVLLPFCVVF
jgi:hypothetical protein